MIVCTLCVMFQETDQMDLRRKMDQKLGNHCKDKENQGAVKEERFGQFTTIAR